MDSLIREIENFKFEKKYNIKDYIFTHAGNSITEDNFNKPKETEPTIIWHGCFFTSRKIKDSSCWLEYCKKEIANDNYYQTDYKRWLNQDKHHYKVRPGANIFICSHDNLIKNYERYFILKKEYNHEKNKKRHSELIDSINKYSEHLDQYKYKYNEEDNAKILKTMSKFSPNSFPDKGPITLKKKDFKNWCYNLKKLASLYKKLHELDDTIRYMKKHNHMESVNYQKIVKDGYDGIYIPEDVIKNRYKYIGKYTPIGRILSDYGADTLMIWNWCLDKITL